MKLLLSTLLLIISLEAFPQNLMAERIWKLPSRKKAVYLNNGIFHYMSKTGKASLKGIRNSYRKSTGYERIVFDFDTSSSPKIYGHISSETKKLYIDLFNTNLASTTKSLTNTKYIKTLDFFNIDTKSLSIELNLKEKVSYDIFLLENPGRLVIDIKK